MKGLLAKKLGMTRVYDDQGRVTPVTVLEAGPCRVLEIKIPEKHGYAAVQIGFGVRKAKNVSRATRGHCRAAGLEAQPPSRIRELRIDNPTEFTVGSEIKADIFKVSEFVDITGTTKGRGFQGVVRRWHFVGGMASHGGGWHRRPGSIGQCEWPGHVDKGKRLPGQMGNVRRTVQNLRVVRVTPEENLLFVKGAVPGPTGGYLLVRGARKKSS